MNTRDFLESQLVEVRGELNEALADNWKLVQQIVGLERQVEDLTRDNAALEQELWFLKEGRIRP